MNVELQKIWLIFSSVCLPEKTDVSEIWEGGHLPLWTPVSYAYGLGIILQLQFVIVL